MQPAALTDAHASDLASLAVDCPRSWRSSTATTSRQSDGRRKLEPGVRLALGSPLTDADHPCCGNLGRAVVVTYLGGRMDRRNWRSAGARTLEQRVFERAAAEGAVRTASAGRRMVHLHQD